MHFFRRGADDRDRLGNYCRIDTDMDCLTPSTRSKDRSLLSVWLLNSDTVTTRNCGFLGVVMFVIKFVMACLTRRCSVFSI